MSKRARRPRRVHALADASDMPTCGSSVRRRRRVQIGRRDGKLDFLNDGSTEGHLALGGFALFFFDGVAGDLPRRSGSGWRWRGRLIDRRAHSLRDVAEELAERAHDGLARRAGGRRRWAGRFGHRCKSRLPREDASAQHRGKGDGGQGWSAAASPSNRRKNCSSLKRCPSRVASAKRTMTSWWSGRM